MDGLVSQHALSSTSDIEAVKSLFPSFEDSRMTDYLTLRSFNFTHEEGMSALGISNAVWGLWMLIPEFKNWVNKDLRRLQRSIGAELLRIQFMRNIFLQMHIDAQILHKRAFESDEMTNDERLDARDAAKRYTAQNLQAMLKVVEEESGDKHGQIVEFKIKVDIGQTEAEEAERRKAQARKLLKDFKLKQTSQTMMTIDGASGQLIDG